MYSTLNRIQNVSSLATSVCLALLAVISVTSWMTIPTVTPGDIQINQFLIAPGSGFLHSKKDYAMLRFDMDADLSPLFRSWNTKQLYVSLTAEYNNTRDGSMNSVVIWDKIIPRTPPSSRQTKSRSKSKRSKPSFVEAYFPQSEFELPTLSSILARPGVPKAAKLSFKNARANHNWKGPSGSFKDIPTAQFTLRYDLMPYVGFLTPGVAGQARNPAFANTTTTNLTDRDFIVPKVKRGGIGS
ncbi:hypothetical protein NliqN6_0811 [Naganishia liquefaciens]|uniref:Signal peptidase subunit 3 n=1 Tax=Naganishia liquefaciens TaxID=104408 RepID=A0A8H3TQE1_9TREE|nr:hypothetical protein NliqN6_0811 [Naganishia liquefaciens]